MKKCFVLIFVIIGNFSYGQSSKRNKEILPSIMVIPRINENEDIRTLVDNNPVLRTGIAAVKDGFDQYEYVTKDFEALFKRVVNSLEAKDTSRKAFRDLLLKQITTDVIVELDLIYVKSTNGNLVRIILEANEVSSANAFGTKTCESNRFYTEDIGSLTLSAMNQNYGNEISCFDSFMNELLIKWNKQYSNGKIAIIDFSVTKNSKLKMDSKIASKNNERLKFIIEDWLNETAHDHYVKIERVTDMNLFVGEYRYGFMETSRNVERNIYKLFDNLEIDIEIENKGESLYVKIL